MCIIKTSFITGSIWTDITALSLSLHYCWFSLNGFLFWLPVKPLKTQTTYTFDPTHIIPPFSMFSRIYLWLLADNNYASRDSIIKHAFNYRLFSYKKKTTGRSPLVCDKTCPVVISSRKRHALEGLIATIYYKDSTYNSFHSTNARDLPVWNSVHGS